MMKLISEQKVYLLQFGEQSPGTLAKLNCLLLPRGVKAVPWCHGASRLGLSFVPLTSFALSFPISPPLPPILQPKSSFGQF